MKNIFKLIILLGIIAFSLYRQEGIINDIKDLTDRVSIQNNDIAKSNIKKKESYKILNRKIARLNRKVRANAKTRKAYVYPGPSRTTGKIVHYTDCIKIRDTGDRQVVVLNQKGRLVAYNPNELGGGFKDECN